MQDEIFFDGVRYLSAADAARSSSFTRDYIARLCKDGILVGRKIGKGWYVKEDSLNEFLVIKTAGQAQRRISLAHERSHEYRLRTEARHAFPEAEQGYDVHHALARAVVRSASVMPAGALDLAVRAIPSPHTASATATFLQKAMALFFAVALTFGTYTAVDPQYMRDLALNTARASTAVVASMRNIATQGMFARTEQDGNIYTAAVGATGVSGALRATVDSFARSVYERVNSLAFSIAFPERLFGVRSGERATVAVGIASGAKAQEVLASASSSPAQARAARTFAQTIVHQPVIQTVLERQSVVGGVSREELNTALNILENKLSTRVYSLTAANSTQVADTYHVVAQTNRIDQLSSVSISDSNWTGGSISGASVSATNLAVSGVSGLATTTIGGALTITSGTASTNPFVVNNTLGTTVFAVANDGTLITNVASTTSSYSSLLVTGSATATNLVVLDTASSTNIFATNSTTTNATTTNLYASAFVSTNATTTNGYVENFVAQNATTTTLFSINASTTNATSTNLYATLGHLVTGIIDSLSATVASITNITAINSTTTNATSTNLAVFTAPIAPAFIATSTTDTSVFNGNLTVGGTANFSGLLSFGIASTSQLSVFNKAYFGATATSTFDSAGNLSLVSNGLTVGANQLVASGGNIGIGITSPTTTLSVGGTTTIAFSQTDSASAATNFRGATYLGLGGQEYNPNSYRLIGFGYNNALSTNYYPAYMGYTETNSTGQTQGDLLFFTRNTTLGTASPTERLRITASGTIGIGTTTPATTLSVQGNQYTSGTAFFGGAVTATSTFTTTATAANTFPFASTTAITSATASTTALNVSGTTILQSITASSLLYNNASQQVGAVSISSPLTFSAGTLSIQQSGAGQNGYLSATDWNMFDAKLASSSLSASAPLAYNSTSGAFSLNIGAGLTTLSNNLILNTANANTWTALQSFANASTSALSAYRAYFGATATSTFDSAGNLFVTGTLDVTGKTTLGAASTTHISASGFGFFGTASTTNLIISGATSGILHSSANGTISASAVDLASSDVTGTLTQGKGGTGFYSYSAGDMLYADGTGNLAKLPIGSPGNVLQVQAGLPAWGVSGGGGGGGASGVWATTTNNLITYPNPTSFIVTIGTDATSTTNSILEVSGQQYISSKLGVATTSPVTALSVGGNGYLTGGLGVGVYNTVAGTLQTSGNATVGGTLTIGSLGGFLKATAGAVSAQSQLALTTDVSGILPVANGGTGWGNITADTLLTGNGTGALATTTVGSSLLLSGATLSLNTGSTNTWTALQSFANASTSALSAYRAYFGATATSTFDSAGNLSVAGTLGVTGNTTLAGATSTSLAVTGITSALHLANGTGGVVAYAGTSCTNQFVRSVNGAGVATCASVDLASDVTGTLGIASGGTATTTGGNTNGVEYFNGSYITNSALFTWDGTTLSTPLFAATQSSGTSTIAAGQGFTIGGSQFVVQQGSGNIGIGITSPTSTLSVGGTTTIAFSQTDSASAATNFHGATYLGLGGQEYNPNSYRLIGFGYNNALSTNYYPAYMGYTETNSTGQTQGDLLFFTRNTTLGTASPTERLRITASGTIGIGTTTPATTLSVQGNQYTSGTAFFGGAVTATSTFTTTATAANTFPFASTTAITSATASTTALNISGTTALQSITASSLLYNNASQQVAATTVSGASGISFAAGTLSLSAIPNTSLANSTISGVALGGTLYSHAHDSTLTGTSYNGSAAVSDWGLNLANANTWTALQQFTNASTTALSAYRAYFGATATSTFDSAGNLSVVSNGLTVGTSQLLVSGGNVGIGTTTPWKALSVVGDIAANHILPNGPYTTNLSSYDLGATGSRWNAIWAGTLNVGTSTFSIKSDSASNLGFFTAASGGGTQMMTLTSGGNVGIGTTTPGSLLSIGNTTGWNFYDNGTTTSYAKGIDLKNGGCFAVNGTCISGGSGTNYWTLSGSNLYNNSGTYIGIGTTTPWGLLSVNPNALGSDVPEFVVGSSTATHLIVTGAGKVGIGTSTPSGNLSIVAAASSWGGIKGYSSTRTNGFFMDFFSASTTIAYNGKVGGFVLNDDQNSAPGLVFKSYDQSFPILFATSHGGGAETTRMAITNSGNVGLGTTGPLGKLHINEATALGTGVGATATTSRQQWNSGSNAILFDTILRRHTAGSDWGSTNIRLQKTVDVTKMGFIDFGINGVVNDYGLGFGSGSNTYMSLTSTGNVGIGTTTPFRLLSLTAAVSTAQTAIAYDTTNNTDILTSSVGDLFLYPSGNDAFFNNANLWVCTGGSGATNGCPSGTPSGFGNLIVETALGVGSSTPFTALALGANMSIVTTEKALTDGATIAISWKDGNQQVVTLGGNRAITFSNYIPGSTLRLVLCQDGTGSRTITSWPAAVLWSGGTAPTLTTTANKCDVLTFLTTAATGTVRVLGSSVLNF